MDWLTSINWLNISQIPTTDYPLLQTYVLATLYYATLGNQWTNGNQNISNAEHGLLVVTDWL